MSSTPRLTPSSSSPPPVTTTTAVSLHNFAFFYLQNTLLISEPVLMRLVLQQSGLLYLKPDRKLMPTVEVYRSFGFTDRNIKTMFEAVPSILAINHDWTLPEKLLSLQSCFHLTKRQLISVCTTQPFVLSSSIDRNMKVLHFLEEGMELSEPQMNALIVRHPTVLTTSLSTLEICWQTLLDIYGMSRSEAIALVLRDPRVLTPAAMKQMPAKVHFLSRHFNLHPPCSVVNKMIAKAPRLLYVDIDYFIRPNVLLLTKFLDLDQTQATRLVKLHPAVLTHNPRTLETRLKQVMFLLTGNTSYEHASGELLMRQGQVHAASRGGMSEVEKLWMHAEEEEEDVVIDTLLGRMDLKYGDEEEGLPLSLDCAHLDGGDDGDRTASTAFELETATDVIFDVVYLGSQKLCEGVFDDEDLESFSATLLQSIMSSLCVEEKRAKSVCASVPWVLSYRPERNQRMATSLAVSLCLSRGELSKVISSYPRVLCLSVDGKLSAVLRLLALGATQWLLKAESRKVASASDDSFLDCEEFQDLEDRAKLALLFRRENNIRRLVRMVVLRYPAILGTALDRISLAIAEVLSSGLDFSDVVKCMRRASRLNKTVD